MVDSRAKGRLALTIAAAVALAALISKPLAACEPTGCPTGAQSLGNTAANALPTYQQPTEESAEPVALKKFTKSQTRTARRTHSRKATLAQRARGSKYAARNAKQIVQNDAEETAAPARSRADRKVAAAVADAKAELVESDTAKPNTADAGNQPQVAAPETQAAAAQPPAVELVSADEFNDLDKVAWEANQMPKLMQLSALDSRAELRDDDSKWAQTSTIGKLFVAFGALLTIGSAIRMFMA
jgi:hypothetical protein